MSEISRLQAWYARQCDGDWEHSYGVDIGTLDNPGWTVSVDLAGTKLEKIAFTPVAEGLGRNQRPSQDSWLSCKIQGKKWKGAGDASKLERILREFLSWAEQHGS